MKVFLRFKEYLSSLARFSNEPLTMRRLLEPFAIDGDSQASEDILLGHVLDNLATEFKDSDTIDCLDVAISASELGFTPAEDFLETGPSIMANAITSQREKRDIC